ncbi:ATP-binding response regulator [Azospirillum rugosum]|uniref:histidine kinase n=1 Tax=Azospirillum rugosum TaxID=416170 RepID=A0ABS4SGG8_9PROT|nr:hybrid sensor histidine kinase/response regulator [Azospirillum rugosum]MBP2291651.1 signal transduction histidine kinase/CheY-like chemotaxis protein [Azospirillum rugosum]MDQ0524537.1 signal transduction histidine kinase/CheY-like chemotaxis protein [Azospirillum rugosum]
MSLRRRFASRLEAFLGLARERQAVQLLDVFQDSIAILGGDGTIIQVNAAWRAFARDSRLEMADAAVGQNYLAACDGAAAAGDTLAAEAAAGIRAVLAGRKSYHLVTYPCHAPTRQRWFQLQASAVDGPGRARAIVRHADATDLVLAAAEQERARAAAETAEQASVAKSRFLAMASHDLRQPMMALRLFLEVMNRRVADPGLRPVLDKANETLAALTGLFESLLDLSQLESGKRSVQAIPIPVDELLDRLRDEFEIMARDKGLSFRTVPCGSAVYGDPILLERILRNFIANAIRYTDRGGLLIGCRRVGQRLRIDVIDTGVGIAPEQKALIFRESYRGDGRHEGDHGYGLGLAIVQRAANLMEVPVEVSSTPGRGSRFSILLPTQPSPQLPGAMPPASNLAGPPARPVVVEAGRQPDAPTCLAVVVEDDPMVALAVRLFLEEFGCTVLSANSVNEAVALVRSAPTRPDVIIANYRLGPGGNGLEAIKRLRADLEADVPAWLITGDVSTELYRRARAERVGYLRKPVRPEEIQACILACDQGGRFGPDRRPRRTG